VSDQDRIRHTLALLAQRLDDGDVAGYVAMYTETGRFESASGEASGRSAIAALLERGRAQSPAGRRLKHHLGNAVIDVDGDTARAVSDTVIYERTDAGQWLHHQINRHHDRLARVGEAWLIVEKRVVRR
jgi:3-phenylpropionate/cinnamic acid dioxygenase small subunit